MVNNFWEKYVQPGRSRRGGGAGWLNPVGRALQQRGTPGGMFLGTLLQAISNGGDNRTPDQQEHAGLVNQNLALHNQGLIDQQGDAAQTRQFILPNAQAQSTILNTQAQRAPWAFEQEKQAAAQAEADRVKRLEDAAAAKKLAEPATAAAWQQQQLQGGVNPAGVVEDAAQAGTRVLTEDGLRRPSNMMPAEAVAPLRGTPAGGVLEGYNLIDKLTNIGLGQRLAVPVAQREAAAAKTLAETKAEEEDALKSANLAMKADLDNFHAIARSNGIKINLGVGDKEVDDIPGAGGRLAELPPEDRAQAMFYLKRRNDMLAAVMNAKSNGGLTRKALAPFFTPEYVAGAFIKPEPPPPAAADSWVVDKLLGATTKTPLNQIGQSSPDTVQQRSPQSFGRQVFPNGVPQGAGGLVEALKLQAAEAIKLRPDKANEITQRLQQLLGNQ